MEKENDPFPLRELGPSPPAGFAFFCLMWGKEKKKKAYLEMGMVCKPQEAVQPMTPKTGVSESPLGGSDLASQNVPVPQTRSNSGCPCGVQCAWRYMCVLFLSDHNFLLVFLFYLCFSALHLFLFTTVLLYLCLLWVFVNPQWREGSSEGLMSSWMNCGWL